MGYKNDDECFIVQNSIFLTISNNTEITYNFIGISMYQTKNL